MVIRLFVLILKNKQIAKLLLIFYFIKQMNTEKNLVKAFEPLNKILVDAAKECIKNFVYKGGAFTDKFSPLNLSM